jgi:hypothetical protein
MLGNEVLLQCFGFDTTTTAESRKREVGATKGKKVGTIKTQ